jgi:hypothetical protein
MVVGTIILIFFRSIDAENMHQNTFIGATSFAPPAPAPRPRSLARDISNNHPLLSLERYGDQQLRRRACPEFVADRAMILMLLEVILFLL